MRTATIVVAALALFVVGCTTKDKCKQNTVLVTSTFDSAAAGADELDVVVQLDQQQSMTATLPGPGGHSTGTLQVEFPHGYHAGSTLQVDVTARLAGADVAEGHASITLAAGCSTLAIAVTGAGADGGGGVPDMIMLPVPVVTAKPDFVGFTTSVDGSGSTDPLGASLTYAWSIAQAPTGSAITTTDLTSTTANKTAFDPDRGGVYKIALTLSAADGRSATQIADVTVPTVPLFYVRGSEDATTSTVGAHVMASDGTGDHSIGCDFGMDGGIDPQGEADLPFFGHAYEPPMGSTASPLFAFLKIVTLGDPPGLVVGSASTNCTTSPPPRVDNNVFPDHIPVAARFSPNGKRIVYVDFPQDSTMGTYRLVTVSVDGVGPKHVVRSDGFYGFTPPIWLDDNTVAWVERDTSSFTPFTIYSAADQNAAGDNARTQVLRCDPATTSTHLAEINQFETSPFGLIVAASTTPRGALDTPPLSAVNLYKLAANDCSTTTAKTLAAEPKGGLSWDFALSPDGLSILFSSTHNEAVPDGGAPEPQTDIFLVAADGSAAPQKITGDPLYDDISPRYVAGGRQFIWSRAPRHLDMGADSPALMIANADGSHVRALVPSVAAGEKLLRTDTGANRGFDCSGIPGAAGAGAATTVAGLLMLLLLARRRRSG